MAKQQSNVALRHLNTLFNLGAVGGLHGRRAVKALHDSAWTSAAELAFAALIDRHGPMVLRVCQAVLGDSQDAQDAFQATFLVLVQKARGLWVRECLGPWLHQVALLNRLVCEQPMPAARRHERLAASSPTELGADEVFDDLGVVLHDEVGRLPEQYRAAVVLCLLEGLTPEQAARRLGWPAGTVHSRLARGRARLRDRLSQRGLAPETVRTDSNRTADPAAVAPALVAATGLAATRLGAGEMLARIASASVVSLTKEGLRIQMISKLLMTAGATLSLGIIVTAVGALGYQATARPGTALPSFQASKTPQEIRKPGTTPNSAPQRPVVKTGAFPAGLALSLAISPDGNTLAAGCAHGSVQLLDAHTGEKRIALADVSGRHIRGLAFTPDGKTIWGVGDNERLQALGRRLREVGLKAILALGDMERAGLPWTTPNTLAITPDGGLIAVGCGGSTIRGSTPYEADTTFFEVQVLDAKTDQLVWSHLGRRGFMQQLAFSPVGDTLASATGYEVKLWDARAGDLKQTLKPNSGIVWSIAFSPDNKLLACGYGNTSVANRRVSSLTIWDLRSGTIVHSIEAGPTHGAPAPGTLAFSPDGKSVASAALGVKKMRTTVQGKEIVRGSRTINYIKLWAVDSGALVWTSAEGDLGDVTSLVFSPDGASLYCCDSSATTRIDAKTGQMRQDLMTVEGGRLR